MKKFWKKAIAKFLFYAALLTLVSEGITMIIGEFSWEYIMFKAIFLPFVVFVYHGLVTGVQYWLMARWAKEFEVDIELVAFTIYTLKYDLSKFVPEAIRRQSIESAKSVFSK